MNLSIFWFRRDLRVEDNTGLLKALDSNSVILPLFIYDENILNELPQNDPRVSFIFDCLSNLNKIFASVNSSILCVKGNPLDIFKELIHKFNIEKVYINKDYEPYAISRDREIKELLEANRIGMHAFKDHLICEEFDVVKSDGNPYVVYSYYRKKWLEKYAFNQPILNQPLENLIKKKFDFPSLSSIGFQKSLIEVKPYSLKNIIDYGETRDYPHLQGTSFLGPHLRFGTVSVRTILKKLNNRSNSFLNELIWREFFAQILFHFPKVVTNNFKPQYDNIEWLNNPDDFEKWCNGRTGYPLVDAGMKELNETGYLHNRVRMITASFLCKHLLTDWRLGEAYFAKKLLDYDLASNNGNWQWVAGTGCDAAPYFRIFNPIEQLKKFDNHLIYVRKHIPSYIETEYISPIIDHKFARNRALNAYKNALSSN